MTTTNRPIESKDFDRALKNHETNCCMFERGVQTLDDLLRSREIFTKVAQPVPPAPQAATVELPPLPKPVHLFPTGKDRYPWGYTAGHVRKYALAYAAAIAAKGKAS